MGKCQVCGKSLPFYQYSCPEHWDKWDVQASKAGVVVRGCAAAFFLGLGCYFTLMGNIMGVAMLGAGFLALYMAITLRKALKAAQANQSQQSTQPAIQDTNP